MKTSWTVLVVDDDPFYRTLYTSLLKQLIPTVSIQRADDGSMALKLLEICHPDLIILDLQMPNMDGTKFVDHISSSNRTIEPDVIAISASDTDIRRIIKAHPSITVLNKPLRADAFEQVIRLFRPPQPATRPRRQQSTSGSLVDYGHMELYIGHAPLVQRTVAAQFFQLAPGRIAEASLLAERGDFSGMQTFCHAMEAGAATIGAHQVAKICRRLRTAARAQDIAEIRELTRAFSQALRQYCVDLCREFDLEEV